MTCHRSGGSGEGVFVVAGTVYDGDRAIANPGIVVRLYSEPDGRGTPLVSIEVDAKGNFYTTERVSFDGGLYATVASDTDTLFMVSPATTGACSSCHGQSVLVIPTP